MSEVAARLVRVKFAYLDESATPKKREYMFGVLLVDEHQLNSIETDMDQQGRLVHEWCDEIPRDAEFHGYDLFHREGPWSQLTVGQSIKLCTNIAKIVGQSGARYFVRGVDTTRLTARYGVNAYPPHEVAMANALEEIEKQMRENFNDERVLVFADEHHTAPEGRTNLRLARDRRVKGKINVTLDHVADTIYFGPSHHSRLLQAVDMATFLYQRNRFHSESHPDARKAMERITRALAPALVYDYIWIP